MSSRRPPYPPLQVSILTKSDYWNEEIIYEIMSKTDPLVPTDRLNKVYPTKPEQDHVHVIAWTRKVNLNCWIVGEYTRRIFPVTISNDQNVADLQGVIKEKRLSAMPKIDELDLMLWKVRSSTISVPSLLIGKGFDSRQGGQPRQEYSTVSRGQKQARAFHPHREIIKHLSYTASTGSSSFHRLLSSDIESSVLDCRRLCYTYLYCDYQQ